MNAIDVEGGKGGPEAMHWVEMPSPELRAGEVLIDITATAVNRADLLQRAGYYDPPSGTTRIMGLECSGTIAAVSAGITHLSVGNQVTALLAGGGYAEQVAVPVGQVMSLPTGVDPVTAGGLPEVACTVWSNLAMTAHLAEGEWVLIHGGGSGIGTFAIQIARALGARVAVTAGTQAKLDACAALGAEILINYNEQDFVEVIRAETGGRGVDVILDNMGAKYLERNVDGLARNGRLVVIGLQGGIKSELNLNTMLRKNISVTATGLRGRPDSEKAAICAAVERTVWPWIAAGIVKPVIDRVMPIDEAGDAHSLIEVGAITGKLVMLVRA